MPTEQLNKTKLIDVALPIPVNDPFSYSVPHELIERIKPGMRILIPFKNREMVGCVVGFRNETSSPKTKDIISVLDEEPVLSEELLALTAWMKDYYCSSWGEAIQLTLPAFSRRHAPLEKAAKHRISDAKIPSAPPEFTLTQEQACAMKQIETSLERKQFASIFIHGVTGSGKTELYIRTIQQTLRAEQSAICLVPEIALTEQIRLFFESRFPNDLEVVHSKLSDGERIQAWNRLRCGEKKVVLGTRSAVFAPVQNLGLVVIDEEQEPSYKEDQSPRYHARQVAEWRCRHNHALLLMGTATPSVETMHQTETGDMTRLELTKRIGSQGLPPIDIVDLNQAREIAKHAVTIAPQLRSAINSTLQKKEGILLLLNRRGFSTQTYCLTCKHPIACRHCDVSLTYHQSEQKLVCHYCNFSLEQSKTCPRCGNDLLKCTGVGTEKVESEVARLFPAARIGRLDSDSIRRKGSYEKILAQFRNRELDILVGTQMIAKGFDFPHVTLVGVILADTALVLPDFRSSEKTFQLLTQVAGRSGRRDQRGRVIIQTLSPLHYSIQRAKDHDAANFFRDEIAHRLQFRYPPFVHLVNIIFRGRSREKLMEYGKAMSDALREKFAQVNIDVIGPAPLPFSKLRGHYRWHLMLKCGNNWLDLAPSLRECLRALKKPSQVHYVIDVDPISIL